MDWRAELDEIASRRTRAQELGGDERIRRQHDAGKLTARERIDLLVDEGTFEELGMLAGHTSQRAEMRDVVAPADGVVTGVGQVDARATFVMAEDFTTLGGSVGLTGMRKRHRVRELAERERCPIVYLLDGAGARGQEFVNAGWVGGEPFLHMARMSGVVPQIAGVMGPLAGDPALEVPLCDFKVMVKHSGMVAAGGPPLVAAATGAQVTKDELGGWEMHTKVTGMVEAAVDSDEEAIAVIRRFLSYLPANCWELPLRAPEFAEPARHSDELLKLVPENRKQPYDMHAVIDCIVDAESFFEIQPAYGGALIVGLTRLEGMVVGIQANQPLCRAGAFGAEEADKSVRFLQLCNSYNVPVLFLTDVPGFMVGPAAEAAGTLKRGLRIASVMAHMRAPTASVLVRKAYGMGAVAMNGPGGNQSITLAWPSAEFGAMPAHGGVAAAHGRAIASSGDPGAAREELEQRYLQLGNPFDAAKAFDFDDLIDPRETRARVAAAFRRAEPAQRLALGPWTYHGIFP